MLTTMDAPTNSDDELDAEIITHTSQRILEWASRTRLGKSNNTYDRKYRFWRRFWNSDFPDFPLLEDLSQLAQSLNAIAVKELLLADECIWCKNNEWIPPAVAPLGEWSIYKDIVFNGKPIHETAHKLETSHQQKLESINSCLTELTSLLDAALINLPRQTPSIHLRLTTFCEKIENLMCSLPRLGTPLHCSLHGLCRSLTKMKSALRGDMDCGVMRHQRAETISMEESEFWQQILNSPLEQQKIATPQGNRKIFSHQPLVPGPE